MSSASYDVVTVGGGLGGAGFARLVAERGAKVLVLERSSEFRDHVRGEVLVPWGVAEAKRLGFDALLRPVGHHLPRWDLAFGGATLLSRDVLAASRLDLAVMTFYHPEMQEILLQAAEDSGAEIRRGARVVRVTPGRPPTVTFELQDGTREVRTRLVIGADGRSSAVRGWGGFQVERDPERRFFAGILFEDMRAPEDRFYSGFVAGSGLMTYVFPQGRGRVRSYIGFQKGTELEHFRGAGDVSRFVTRAQQIGVPKEWYAGARAAGPLATFDCTDEWVSRPYRDGIALVGDAAATSDPTWGQGMSITLRDLRILRDELLSSDEWDEAGAAYAEKHDECYKQVHPATDWYTDLLLDVGSTANARRALALPLILMDPTRILDTLLGGPEIPADEPARRRFFGEDIAS